MSATFAPGSTALQPLAPVHLRAARGGSGIVFSWTRRTRFDGDSWEALDVPLGESVEAYEIDILDGETVMRVLTASGPTVLYPAADEIADFGAPQSSIAVRVTQLSAVAGRGCPAQATLAP